MDETPLSFDIPSNMTVEETGASTVSIRKTGHEKSNFTVVLSCMEDGTKLPPLIIFKLVNVPFQIFPSGVVIRADREGYMNSDEMIWWIENVWNLHATRSINPCSLLVLDTFRGHLTDVVKRRFDEKNTNLAVVPGGLTSKLQPLDVCINKSFKNKYRESEWVQTSWEKCDERNDDEYDEYNEENNEIIDLINDENDKENNEIIDLINDKELSNDYSENRWVSYAALYGTYC
ncbi:9557_t:CDS:2 [Diversispora eburnea]|uniref:9557_t:CDS:1 n=1 Tax=Diversispora eburnea TaxID=1213867 RepID=A0A9N8V0C2_9GLOM|nr:9557_t:CDS:2 [Diversispora eburnea]